MSLGIFSKKPDNEPAPVFTDKTYISTSAKMNACLDLVRKDPATLFICWFPETARKLKAFFAQYGIEGSAVTEASHYHNSNTGHNAVVFAEHHPLHQKELELVKDWGREKIIVFSSMDEPLFRHFGSEKMIPLMKLLGMKEAEAIEHSYVTKAITRGQEKIAGEVIVEQFADSQQKWMELNIKQRS